MATWKTKCVVCDGKGKMEIRQMDKCGIELIECKSCSGTGIRDCVE